MLLIKSQNITPKRRWQIYIKPTPQRKSRLFRYYYSVKHRANTKISGFNIISGVRYKYKVYLFKFFLKKIKTVPLLAFDINHKKYPLKEFIWCKSLYNQVYTLLGSYLMYPGFKLYNFNHLLLKNLSMINQFIPLEFLPINAVIIYLFNSTNNYIAYAKSSGCSAIKKKNMKKQKLSYVELSSGSLRLFPLYVFCLLSTPQNLYKQMTIDGGWGFFTKPKKGIKVRGVAKNPVDHPNGGRTKAKQPELSPWGWIAKQNK